MHIQMITTCSDLIYSDSLILQFRRVIQIFVAGEPEPRLYKMPESGKEDQPGCDRKEDAS